MPTLPNKEAQARLLRHIIDMDEKKRKLEDDIRTLDSLNKSLMENEARKDIEAYRNRHPSRSHFNDAPPVSYTKNFGWERQDNDSRKG